MNKNIIYNALWFVVGAAVGGSCSYFYCKKTENERLDKEIQSVIDAFKHSNQSKKPKNEEKTQETPSLSDLLQEDQEPDEVEPASPETKAIYYNMISKYKSDMADNPEAAEIVSQIVAKDAPIERDDPYVMTEDEVSMADSSDMIFATVYVTDHILADDATNEELDVSTTIGWDIMNKILNSTPEEIFVMDPRTDSIYDITVNKTSYIEMMDAYHGGV